MKSRRSVRQFSGEAVPFELIENALRAAGTAPSGANQQPWTFVVVGDPGLKERIRVAAEREEELLYKERASQEWLEAIEPIGTDWIKAHITDAPYVIVVFEQAWSPGPDGTKIILIPVGYPAADAEVPDIAKKPLDEISDFR